MLFRSSHLQGILPSQGSNPGLLHCRQILYRLSHQGSPNFSSPFSGRKVKLREGKGLPETTQQAGGRGTCDPSLGAVGLSGQEGLSRKSRLPSGPTHSAPGAVDKRPLQAPPPEHIPLIVQSLPTPRGSPGPQPLVPAQLETAPPGWLGPKSSLVIGFLGCSWLC